MTDASSDLDRRRAAGELLRHAREEAGLSRAELAELVDVHANRLVHIERGFVRRDGDSEPRPTRLDRVKLLAICNTLRISADVTDRILELCGYSALDRSREIVYLHELTPEQQKKITDLVAKFRRQPPR
jgi:transcriptional regulator with XRE-family HTH domain